LATIEDVARHAGVSMKTVSRVLNNEPHVREELRKRVQGAAAALNYLPNQAARRLAGKRSFLIAYLYDNPNPAYVFAVQAGAARRCRELGCHLVVEPINSRSETSSDVIHRLMVMLAPDGIILTPPLSDNADLVAALKRQNVRVARIAGAVPGNDIRIFMDEQGAGRSVTAHLLSLGHRRIGIIRGHPEHSAAAKRLDGYREALTAAGVRFDAKLVAQGYFDLQSGVEAGRKLLSMRERPTAVFATNDEMALGVVIAAREQGISVPQDLSLAGFDDIPLSRQIWPALTTIRQPLEEMGWSAVEALLNGKSVKAEIELPFELKVRASTAPPPRD